jgi:cell wall-associated NlpC family hydrolase
MGNEIQDLGSAASAHDAEASYACMQRAVAFRMWYRVDVPELGDVVAMALEPEAPEAVGHAGVYLEEGRFLHTLVGHECCIARIDDHFYKNKIRGYYRWDR